MKRIYKREFVAHDWYVFLDKECIGDGVTYLQALKLVDRYPEASMVYNYR